MSELVVTTCYRTATIDWTQCPSKAALKELAQAFDGTHGLSSPKPPGVPFRKFEMENKTKIKLGKTLMGIC